MQTATYEVGLSKFISRIGMGLEFHYQILICLFTLKKKANYSLKDKENSVKKKKPTHSAKECSCPTLKMSHFHSLLTVIMFILHSG